MKDGIGTILKSSLLLCLIVATWTTVGALGQDDIGIGLWRRYLDEMLEKDKWIYYKELDKIAIERPEVYEKLMQQQSTPPPMMMGNNDRRQGMDGRGVGRAYPMDNQPPGRRFPNFPMDRTPNRNDDRRGDPGGSYDMRNSERGGGRGMMDWNPMMRPNGNNGRVVGSAFVVPRYGLHPLSPSQTGNDGRNNMDSGRGGRNWKDRDFIAKENVWDPACPCFNQNQNGPDGPSHRSSY